MPYSRWSQTLYNCIGPYLAKFFRNLSFWAVLSWKNPDGRHSASQTQLRQLLYLQCHDAAYRVPWCQCLAGLWNRFRLRYGSVHYHSTPDYRVIKMESFKTQFFGTSTIGRTFLKNFVLNNTAIVTQSFSSTTVFVAFTFDHCTRRYGPFSEPCSRKLTKNRPFDNTSVEWA